jgi:hypothetical protein
LESGGGLLSRAVTHQVPSALKGLTSVFGMGTGDPLRHCHRKLWRSRGSGAQVAFTLPSRPSPWSLPTVSRRASDRRVSLSTVVSRLPRRPLACARLVLRLPLPGLPSAKCSAACWALPLAFSLLPLPYSPQRLRWPHLDNRTTSDEISRFLLGFHACL